ATRPVGYVQQSLNPNAQAPTNVEQCSTQPKTAVNVLSFTPLEPQLFKTRIAAQTNVTNAGQGVPGQGGLTAQNVPGGIYNSESGLVLSTPGGLAGLTDFGTRLKAVFNNVPSGVRLFVSTSNVNNAASPVAPPTIIGGTTHVNYAQLMLTESGAYSPVAASDFAPGNSGSVPVVEIPVVGGTATAVWEVVNAVGFTNSPISFAVYATNNANASTGSATVSMSLAPPPG